MADKPTMLVKQETYLEAGVHIGTKIRTHDMREFVFKRRDDGLYILDLRKADERLLMAAKLLAKYEPSDILIVASRTYSGNPANKLVNLIPGVELIRGRFIPGTMTNLEFKKFKEPKIIFVCDPKGEKEAIVEASNNGVPIISLCDTDNDAKFVDLVVPINNKGNKSLALVFYLLSRELMLYKGLIKSYEEFPHEISYFEQMEMPVQAPAAPIVQKQEVVVSEPVAEVKAEGSN